MKKKLLAIVLTVVMVFACVAVLAACQDNEYTVTFRNNSGGKYFELKTKGGKLSQAEVEAETAKLSNGDQMFMGWYGAVDQVDGVWVYSDPIDYDKVYTAKAEYYANWHVGAGLPQGYTLIGVIGTDEQREEWTPEGFVKTGDTDWWWTPGLERDEWMLVQDKNSPWLYRTTIDVVAGNAIKVKEKSDKWNDNICNLGWDGLAEIKLADGVTLPEGIKIEYLIQGSGKSNVMISNVAKEMNITVEYDYSILKFRITINSVEAELPETESEWIIVGAIAEGSWEDNTTDETRIFSKTDEKYVSTLTYTFRANDEFKLKKNIAGDWSGEVGGVSSLTIKGAAGVTVPKDLFSGDDNIVVAQACKVKITFNEITRVCEVEVLEIIAE